MEGKSDLSWSESEEWLLLLLLPLDDSCSSSRGVVVAEQWMTEKCLMGFERRKFGCLGREGFENLKGFMSRVMERGAAAIGEVGVERKGEEGDRRGF